MNDLEKALGALIKALDHHIGYRGENPIQIEPNSLPLLDEVWYAKEIAEYVLNGDSWEEAGRKFFNE